MCGIFIFLSKNLTFKLNSSVCECGMSPTASSVWTPGRQVVALFGEGVETPGGGASSEEGLLEAELEVVQSDSAYSPLPVSW